jgi:hypothetical protein
VFSLYHASSSSYFTPKPLHSVAAQSKCQTDPRIGDGLIRPQSDTAKATPQQATRIVFNAPAPRRRTREFLCSSALRSGEYTNNTAAASFRPASAHRRFRASFSEPADLPRSAISTARNSKRAARPARHSGFSTQTGANAHTRAIRFDWNDSCGRPFAACLPHRVAERAPLQAFPRRLQADSRPDAATIARKTGGPKARGQLQVPIAAPSSS